MKIESIYDARAIAREFHTTRNIVEWNRMFPHMQVKEVKKPRAEGSRSQECCPLDLFRHAARGHGYR